jgi:hypothetical protein
MGIYSLSMSFPFYGLFLLVLKHLHLITVSDCAQVHIGDWFVSQTGKQVTQKHYVLFRVHMNLIARSLKGEKATIFQVDYLSAIYSQG